MYLLAFRRLRGAYMKAFKSADRREAMKFSVEGVWDNDEIPMGVHKPWWGSGEFKSVNIKKLQKSCPEISLLCPYARKQVHKHTRSGGQNAMTFIREVCD